MVKAHKMSIALDNDPEFENTPKLTDWENEPGISDLKSDLDAAKPAHDAQYNKITDWLDALNIKGKYKPKKIKGRSSVQPRLVRRQNEWHYPSLSEAFLNNDKMFAVNPVTHEDRDSADQNELVLNYQFRTKINQVKFIDNYVKTAIDEGTVIVRLGWSRVTRKETVQAPVFEFFQTDDPEHQNAIQKGLELKQQDPDTFDRDGSERLKQSVGMFEEQGIHTIAQEAGTEEVESENLLENKPTIEVVNSANIYIDPSCGNDFDNALFVVVSFETNQADLKKYPERYSNLDKVDWENATINTEDDHVTSTPLDFNLSDPIRKKVVAYEYWGFYDIHDDGQLVPFVATWIGRVMIRMEEAPFPDKKLPFVIVPCLPVVDSVYGEADAELITENQMIMGAVSRGMIDLMGRSANSQRGFAKSMLDPLNRRRYENGEDYEFNPNVPIQQGLIEHKFPEIPQSAIVMLQMQGQEAEALTGGREQSQTSISTSKGGQAKSGVLSPSQKREMAILRRLAKGLEDIGRKIISMNTVFLSEEETIRITNQKFVKVKRDNLKGNFDLSVDVSSAESDNIKANDLGFMLQTMGPKMSPELSQKILSRIAKLKKMPDLAYEISEYKPQPDPIEQQIKQLQLEMAKLELQDVQSKIQERATKAKNNMADAEKTSLDTQEQRDGIKHARDLEKSIASDILQYTDISEQQSAQPIIASELESINRRITGIDQENSLPLPQENLNE